ncbi:universal stress protein [Streptomyces sp. NPDC086766]|uniref:universal stress protein n=1 Tax=Streptomyces sp. NPDC086766 TaxID=3365754 RepID=UPI00382EA5E8
MDTEAEPARRIVVGVDGSDPPKAALRWAVRQAALTGGVVEAVTAWQDPPWYGAGPVAAGADCADDVAEILTQAIDETCVRHRPVEIRPQVVYGNPASVLLYAGRGAELLAVGNRGHGGFPQALPGSAGQHLVQHAECPVVVIRGPADVTSE